MMIYGQFSDVFTRMSIAKAILTARKWYNFDGWGIHTKKLHAEHDRTQPMQIIILSSKTSG